MNEISQITMISVDCVNQGGAIAALKKSQQQIKPARTILLTDREMKVDGIEVIKIDSIKSKREYSRFIIKELYKYFTTSHVLLVQADGYIISGDQWTDEFLEWDYIGSPWNFDAERLVGNGGMSARSHKLCKILGEDDFIDVVHPEDQSICVIYKFYLEEKYGIKFSPVELAEKFGFELREPIDFTLGFHGNFWPKYRKTIVIRRWASLGDVCMTEPILHYYWQKGYRVILDTLPQFYELFRNHYFPVEYYGSFNQRVKHEYLNLDMSYESDPQKLHLKAYYEFAGISESEQIIRNPRLNYYADEKMRLFPQKYVCIHVDNRNEPSRNCYGIEWAKVIKAIEDKGYLAIQIGKNEHEKTGAIEVATLAEPMMAYAIAGCELMLAVDSGPANVAVALGRKLIVFHGSVNPDYIWPDQTNIRVITNHKKEEPLCQDVYCWHSEIGCTGKECYLNALKPPCVQFKTEDVITAINELI
jgi:ADP-heptose:LPS heptosyltransferase